MAFNSAGTQGNGNRDIELVLLDDSITANIGDVYLTYSQADDVATYGVAAQPIFGILNSITDKYGNPHPVTTVSAGTAASTTADAQATGSTNTTTKTYWGLFDKATTTKYSATVSGTLGTINNSNKRGVKIDVDSENTTYGQLLETTATRTIATPANFYSHGVDPSDSTRLIVSIAMSEMDSVLA